MRTHTKESLKDLSPRRALEFLKEGNLRFQTNLKLHRDLLEQVNNTAEGQFPFAIVLSCIDSRTSAELIFDQGLGDIFSVRIAGNILNEDILGSMEFACKLAGSKLIVVLGHSACGAVKGACAGAELGNLSSLLQKIRPSVDRVRASGMKDGPEFMQAVAADNVHSVVEEVRQKSPVLDSMIAEGEIGLVGGLYSVSTGKIEFEDLVCGD